ncbi:MAG: hypothetical protein MR750_00335 [Methanobrevibacter boviskoreani]|uniref:hypothetical protein n=1 Tax=Methanobrevibacter boviskoreani TaxID=1348249 RepID=UPI0023A8ECC9|nr:hypothetical protein [Methanobrevibacter boviskoreani]MCI6929690.1 hypothetical protein [Methanobrevibacter boviskoreani]
MLLKTTLLLINIAIICVVACLIVKLYYRDEEKGKIETHENIERKLKSSTQVPKFEDTPKNKKQTNTLLSNKDKILKTTSKATSRITGTRNSNKVNDEEALNKEIESLTITRPKPNNNTGNLNPKTNSIANTAKTTENKINKTQNNNIAKTTKSQETRKIVNENQNTIKDKNPNKIQKPQETEIKPISINVKNAEISTDAENKKEDKVEPKLKTTATEPKTTIKETPKVKPIINKTSQIKESPKAEANTVKEAKPIKTEDNEIESTNVKTNLKTEPSLKVEPPINNIEEETIKTNIPEEVKTETTEKEAKTNKEVKTETTEKVNKPEIKTKPSISQDIDIKPTIKEETKPTNKTITEKETKIKKDATINKEADEINKPEIKTKPSINHDIDIKPTIKEETKPTNKTRPETITEKETKGENKPDAEEKSKPFELNIKDNSLAEGIASNITQEPIEDKHQSIIDKTRKITNPEPIKTEPATIDDYAKENEEEKDNEFEQSAYNDIIDPFESVKGAFKNIKSSIVRDDSENGENLGNTNEAVLEEVLNNNKENYEDGITYNDNVVSITPLHDPEEIKKYEESIKPDYDTHDVFNNINGNTDELTPEEIEYFDNLEKEFNDELDKNEKNKSNYIADKTDDMKITVKKSDDLSNLKPSERFHKKYGGKSSEKKSAPKSLRRKEPEQDLVINLQGTDHILKRGVSIIYQYKGEKYGSSIHSINGNNINVTYRGKKIWIKPEDITKVF